MTKLLLIDGNNIGFSCMHGAQLRAGDKATQAIFGFVRTMHALLRSERGTPIVLWDGRSWRRDVYPEYKENRRSNPKMAELAARYKEQRPDIGRACASLGITQVIASNLEADDLAGMLVRKRRTDMTMISGDRDWLQLVQPGVDWFDPIHNKRVRIEIFEECTGYATPRHFVEGKALQGDTSDNIPGVGGIGEKGAEDLIRKYGSVKDFMIAFCNGPEVKEKKYRKFAESLEAYERFERNIDLMDLASPKIPAPVGLKTIRTTLDAEKFAYICGEFAFHSILGDLEAFLAPFKVTHD